MSGGRGTIRFRAMNTDIEVLLDYAADERRTTAFYADRARDWFEAVEQRFSRFRSDSEWSRLGRSAGSWNVVSDWLFEVIEAAENYRLMTEGVFDLRILPGLEASGYSQSFEHAAAFQARAGGAEQRKLSLAGELELDYGMKAVKLAEGTSIDAGGIAKGWAVQKLADWLRRSRRIPAGIVNAGGDLYAWNSGDAAAQPAIIDLQHPWEAGATTGELLLANGAVATSGTLGRRWGTGSSAAHHLIDPLTMQPSDSDVVQAAVAGPDAVACEIWAKTLCIGGLDKGIRLMGEHARDFEAVIFMSNGEIVKYGKSRKLGLEWNIPEQLHRAGAATRAGARAGSGSEIESEKEESA
ncbi:thiamine biosynthesis lipoprotein [Paenibacillus algorifonticola]|uniref:FAD:protein FMN transferase n=1 Tax=Paenibacillus algorifonticola TaxID=684063 RepID=A0A1I2GB51_9BACL|nr:FAD:protein FMN transferase [Paenibacillus algorifonticola]SFF14157.1 thiamine biosynthesis lipoprotein [Paenibacillus algorifonticola]